MKRIKTITLLAGLAGFAVAAWLSGCAVSPYGGVAVEAPASAVAVEVYPDDYIWDGYEYIGIAGGQYYYLGPNHVWIRCEPFRVARFHDWERVHPDWHTHTIPNEHYRPANPGHDHDSGHDRDNHHDHDHGH